MTAGILGLAASVNPARDLRLCTKQACQSLSPREKVFMRPQPSLRIDGQLTVARRARAILFSSV